MTAIRPIDYLLGFQKRLAKSRARFVIALWSRQTGKGYTTSFIATRGAIREDRSNWLIVSPTERQSLETLEKCKAWLRMAHLIAAETEEELVEFEAGAKVNAKTITLPNGSRIHALPGCPASLRGFTGYLILDEFAFFEDEKEIWKAVFATVTNPMRGIKRIIITSTPNGQGDLFHKFVDENLLNPDPKRRMKWEVQKVTIHQAAKEWEKSGRLGTVVDAQTGRRRAKTAADYVEECREAFDCPEAWPQEFECQFLDTSASVFTYEMLNAAESVEATEHGFLPDEPGEFYGGFDFGGLSDPSVFWLAKDVDGRLVTREVRTLRKLDTVQQLEAVAPMIEKCSRVCVDYTGAGRGFGDLAANRFGAYEEDPQSDQKGKIEKCTFTDAFKRDVFTKLRQCFVETPATFAIPHTDWIRQDFHSLQMIASGNDFKYWSPRTSAGHSDGCCAAALCKRASGFGMVPAVQPPDDFDDEFYMGGTRIRYWHGSPFLL